MLEISNFSNDILSHINFKLKDSENLIILGSNGAGKSTLAKLLCGITPNHNTKLFGKYLDKINTYERAKLINYIPPKLDIFDEYITLYEYLELSRLNSQLTINDVLSILHIQHLKDKSCKTLSSGESQLMLLSSAILHNAEITIFDEPTSNLDTNHIVKIYELLKSNHFKNRIVITHDLNLAYRLGYKILHITDGKIDFFDDNSQFFEPNNIQNTFGNSVKKVNQYYVVNL
jgi:iron complex transport system ATP-binding protein